VPHDTRGHAKKAERGWKGSMAATNGFGLAGIIGMPVAHSRSPTIHNFWLNTHGIRGAYVPLAVKPERLKDALAGLVGLGFRGCNVTMPHKQMAMQLLDRVNDTARRIGAVNTIVVEEDGTLSGFNNDGNGFVQSLKDAKSDWRADAGPILLLGAGGASRAVVVALLENGARQIRISNRTPGNAQAIADEFGSAITTVAWSERAAALADAALLVNCTDRGMIGKDALEIDLSRLSPATLAADLIYTPLETPFLAEARARGCLTVNGLGLLLNQARLAFKAWFGVMPEVSPDIVKAIVATF
jgi:shikimate dehydrogenase